MGFSGADMSPAIIEWPVETGTKVLEVCKGFQGEMWTSYKQQELEFCLYNVINEYRYLFPKRLKLQTYLGLNYSINVELFDLDKVDEINANWDKFFRLWTGADCIVYD